MIRSNWHSHLEVMYENLSSEDESSQSSSADSSSDGDCQILEEKWENPSLAKFLRLRNRNRVPLVCRTSVISGQKRAAEEPILNPRLVKQPAVQDNPASEPSNAPATSSQRLVQPPAQGPVEISDPLHARNCPFSNNQYLTPLSNSRFQCKGCSAMGYPLNPLLTSQYLNTVPVDNQPDERPPLRSIFEPLTLLRSRQDRSPVHNSDDSTNSHPEIPPLQHSEDSPQLPNSQDSPPIQHDSPQLFNNHDSPPIRHDSPQLFNSPPMQNNPDGQTHQTFDNSTPLHPERIPFLSSSTSQTSPTFPVPTFIESPSEPMSSNQSGQLPAPSGRVEGSAQATNEPQTSLPFAGPQHNSPVNDPRPEGNTIAAALDLSNSGGLPSSRLHLNSTIWRGSLLYQEKIANTSNAVTLHSLKCKYTFIRLRSFVNTSGWPVEMQLRLMPFPMLKEMNVMPSVRQHASCAHVCFEEDSNIAKKVKETICKGWFGVVRFSLPFDENMMIIVYYSLKRAFVGFLPNDQKGLFRTFRRVYERRLLQGLLDDTERFSSNQPTSSSTSSMVEPNQNPFVEIDNEIDAHISALRRRNMEPQPSTSQQEPGPSHNQHSIEDRLNRLEAAQNAPASNTFEEIDNEINTQIAAHWMHHYSMGAGPSTSQPPPRASLTTLQTARLPNSPNLWLPPPTGRSYYPSLLTMPVFAGIPESGPQSIPLSNPLPYSPRPQQQQQENPVVSEACDIFPRELVLKVVEMKQRRSGSGYTAVDELCDDILRYEESRPKPVEGSTSEELLCKICLDERMNTVFQPCGHLATCQDCSKTLTKCPICRTFVHYKMKIYIS